MNNTIYEQIGGEEKIRRLVNRFYDLMDTRPEAEVIRRLHPDDLSESREKLYMFLVGWTGGPPLYMEKFGHPRLRARHMPFPIGELERDQWLWCMNRALEEVVEKPLLRQQISLALGNLADFMRNREG
ncbi:MAG: group II truncated hemoglobin [Acidobacteriota bacterium]|nr:MAG: group II truncated hemoglobin [Acidobacteriota bacterium]